MARAELKIAVRFTLVTTILLGIVYPLAITGAGRLFLRQKADGQLIVRHGKVIGSAILGQSFTGERYFHDRPSAAGNGYDATASGGSNLSPSNRKLIERIRGDVAHYAAQGEGEAAPIDLVTASGSGLDPDISPAAALFQAPRIARVRHTSNEAVRALVLSHVQGRQFGVLGEPRVNVLALNLALDQMAP